jgi:two-component system, OmpR family, sensor histidine kinase MprB
MSLRRRITAATTLAVAAVALTLGMIGYLSARSHLIGDTRQQLSTLVTSYQRFHLRGGGNGVNGGTPGNRGAPGAGSGVPGTGNHAPGQNLGLPSPPLGGAPGYFQTVYPDGTAVSRRGGTPELPVTAEVKTIARTGHGSFYRSATVRGIHVEVLTVPSPFGTSAVEVALPLTGVDNVLHGLLITYALLVGLGVLIAGLIGALVARAALLPINRFSDRTEQVTSALHAPHRLEGGGASELQRLAASFNQMLEALERSIQAQRHLIADASHELRTPMAALRSNIQIFLEAEALPQEERAELQEAIIAELDELTQLVSDVLDLARGTTPSDHIEAVELDTLVREAIARARRRAPQLTFETELEQTVIDNAPERVARAIGNVIENARKWSPPDGRVEVTLADGVLRVRDHGPGFKQADIAHVFDRFYRADEARRLPGSGLGLAIVRQAAEAYGGSVSAANADDGGAVVELVFGSRPARGLVQTS